MATLPRATIIQYAQKAGFKGQALDTAVAIALAESGGNTGASHTNNGGSVDRGLFQINNLYHSEVSDACAYDPACAAAAAYRISNGGSNFTPWTTFTSGAYKQYTGNVSSSGGTTTGSTSGSTLSGNTVQPAGSNLFTLNLSSIPGAKFTGGTDPSYTWLAAWVVAIVLLVLLNKTRLGHVIIYYALWLILILLVLLSAQGIAKILAPLGQPVS